MEPVGTCRNIEVNIRSNLESIRCLRSSLECNEVGIDAVNIDIGLDSVSCKHHLDIIYIISVVAGFLSSVMSEHRRME